MSEAMIDVIQSVCYDSNYDKYDWREDDKGRLYLTPAEKQNQNYNVYKSQANGRKAELTDEQ